MIDVQCAQPTRPRRWQLRQRVQQSGRIRAAAESDAQRGWRAVAQRALQDFNQRKRRHVADDSGRACRIRRQYRRG
jgi:hypothetical protein